MLATEALKRNGCSSTRNDPKEWEWGGLAFQFPRQPRSHHLCQHKFPGTTPLIVVHLSTWAHESTFKNGVKLSNVFISIYPEPFRRSTLESSSSTLNSGTQDKAQTFARFECKVGSLVLFMSYLVAHLLWLVRKLIGFAITRPTRARLTNSRKVVGQSEAVQPVLNEKSWLNG